MEIEKRYKCRNCGEVLVSNSLEHHKMDNCGCGDCGVDLESYSCRYGGFPKILLQHPGIIRDIAIYYIEQFGDKLTLYELINLVNLL